MRDTKRMDVGETEVARPPANERHAPYPSEAPDRNPDGWGQKLPPLQRAPQ